MRIFVELPNDLDAADWGTRHRRGLAPDVFPYGLQHLGRDGDVVRFRPPLSPAWSSVVRRASARTWGWEVLPEILRTPSAVRRSADVIVAMDERTGAPAAALAGGIPVVSGVAWIEEKAQTGQFQAAVIQRLLRRSAAVFTLCTALRPTLVSEFGLRPDRVHTIPFGIDADFFARQPWPEGPPTVFSVGDDPMRDYPTLLAAMERVRRRQPATRLELATTLPVDLPSDMGRVYRRRMDHAIRERYAAAQVVAVALEPTRQGSGLTVALEAMASGRPLVITANPGLEQYVEDGVTGVLVPPGDPDAMSEAIGGLLADPARSRAMGEAGRRRVESTFTSRHMAVALRGVLDRAVA